MNKKKTLLISASALGALTVGSIGAIVTIGNHFYNLALNPNASKKGILDSNTQKESNKKKSYAELDWVLNSVEHSEVYIKSYDKLKLSGYKIINNNLNDVWVITVHGYNASNTNMIGFAKKFFEAGYNLLIPDLRGHGKSEGKYIGMGWEDRLDIIKWIEYILQDNTNAKIILHGLSMGAATVTMASGENLPSNVKAIIADCGYTSALDQFTYKLKTVSSLPKSLVLNPTSLIAKIRAGYNLKDASSIEQVKKSKTPILFIHGDEDDFVPYYMMDELYTAANCEKEKLTIKGAKHAESLTVNPELYWNTINNFITKYL